MGPHPTDWVGAPPGPPVATVAGVRHGISIPPYEELSDPNVVARLAVAAERSGWDGVFVWDHVMRPPEETELIGSATVSLAAIAAATSTIRFGAMVTPLTRRRPQVFARETAALDRMSSGRLIVGLGLGVDRGGELSKFGEETEPREMARRLEAGAEFLIAAWSGEPFARAEEPFAHDDVRFLPRPVQRPHPPIWFAARGEADRPVRRAARLGQGIDLVEASADRVREVADLIASIRGDLEGFDIVCPVEPGTAGDEWTDTPVSWCMHEFESPPDLGVIERVIDAGPPR
jgi:alkanesulfonate monooxygenase SsuD/methylene tetrahydromethanopterin reductase-like flavin-dependent oxidoreductase (luciferase family)